LNIQIFPSCLTGTVAAPPSKSVAHRAIICAALSKKAVILRHIDFSDDIRATIEAVKTLGKEVRAEKDIIHLRKDIISAKSDNIMIDCHESGSTARFIIPILAVLGKMSTVTGRGKLPERHFAPIIDLLSAHGIVCSSSDTLPLTLYGNLEGTTFEICGDISSQFITGLLLALPLLPHDSEISLTTHLESKPYIDITLDVLKAFGIEIMQDHGRFIIKGNSTYHSNGYTIEGDYSNGAFFLAAAAISGHNITVCDLSNTSVQGDRAIVDLLAEFGTQMHIGKDTVTVQGGSLKGIEIDAEDIPDLVPILAVIASFAQGKTRIYHVSRLRIKESDRLAAITDGLNKMGADISVQEDELIINGREKLAGGCEVSSYGDHRIAMALSVAATCSENPVTILGAECINKSYPNFYQDFNAIGGKTNVFNLG